MFLGYLFRSIVSKEPTRVEASKVAENIQMKIVLESLSTFAE
jgi:hypothetical protein